MAKPVRNSTRHSIIAGVRTFFVSSRTVQGKHLLQSQRSAELLIDVLRSYTLAGRFKVHEFVVMPDHFHVLVSLNGDTSIERAVQLIKGGSSKWVHENFPEHRLFSWQEKYGAFSASMSTSCATTAGT